MKTITLAAVLAATLTTTTHADTFATAAVKGESKGKTILTTDACTLTLDAVALGTTAGNLAGMRRAFYYTDAGATEEGCWRHDAGTVLLVGLLVLQTL